MKNALHRGLQLRLWFYFLLTLAELGLAIMHVLVDGVFVVFPLAGLGVGIFFGRLISKAFHISWDEESMQVITRWDTFGVVILVLSGVLEAFKETLVGYFVNGPAVVGVSFAFIAGVMFGRLMGLSHRSSRILEENI